MTEKLRDEQLEKYAVHNMLFFMACNTYIKDGSNTNAHFVWWGGDE